MASFLDFGGLLRKRSGFTRGKPGLLISIRSSKISIIGPVPAIENYLEQNGEELGRNGYKVLKGKRLKNIKLAIQGADVPEIDFGNIKMTPQLGVFDFRAFLNRPRTDLEE